jgi:hypothetical protein
MNINLINDREARERASVNAVDDWEAFEDLIKREFEDPSRKLWDEVWFRGQENADWGLHTTLERRSAQIRKVRNYLNLIGEIRPAIEAFTNNTFDTPDGLEMDQICRDYDLFPMTLRRWAIYLAHLRHCGFPSPLLDWSISPYVAAYFAFARARHDRDVAIYAYREQPDSIKVHNSNEPQIITFGPNVRTHKRHFRQQSRYTACVKFEGSEWLFEPHDSVFGLKDNLNQDLLWKITIPARERIKALRYLDKFNLNQFTLFDSEDALLEMLALRFIDMRQS